MNQDVDVGERPLETPRCGRFEPRGDDPLGTRNDERRGNAVVRRQRERGTVVIVEGLIVVRVVIVEETVRFRVTMNDGVSVSVLFGFVHVLGRGHGEPPHRGAHHTGKHPGPLHGWHRMRPGVRRQLKRF